MVGVFKKSIMSRFRYLTFLIPQGNYFAIVYTNRLQQKILLYNCNFSIIFIGQKAETQLQTRELPKIGSSGN